MSFKSLAKAMPVLYYIIVILYCLSNNDKEKSIDVIVLISIYLKIFSTFGLMKPKT